MSSSRLRVLVVDDEPLARDMMVALLEKDDDVTVIGTCNDGKSAVQFFREAHADIVFLDIEMPGINGIEVARGLSNDPPAFVFVTAFSEYAPEAFDVEALDYVLKPFSDGRFFEALERAKRRVRERTLSETAEKLASTSIERPREVSGSQRSSPSYLERLPIRQGDRSLVLKVEEITWVKAEDYYVLVHSSRGKHLVRTSMAALEAQLDPGRFLRVHRAALVNVSAVTEVERLAKGLAQIVLSDGTRVPISRSRRGQIEELLLPRLRTRPSAQAGTE